MVVRFPLPFIDNAQSDRYRIGNLQTGTYKVRIQLPPDVTCSQCILQVALFINVI